MPTTSRRPGVVVQECAAGLVNVHRETGVAAPLAFTAPPTTRSGPLSDEVLVSICTALRIGPEDVVAHQWVVNGPEWAAVQLGSAQDVLDLQPDFSSHPDLMVGALGFYPDGADNAADLEIPGFAPAAGIAEDPVTGSLNASVGQWFLRSGRITGEYTAFQGTLLHRTGRLRITPDGTGNVLVGGATTTLFRGTAEAPTCWPPALLALLPLMLRSAVGARR
ncbi:PhzF family phenazine biosynthesis protein [Corynebacterium glyciniphilum]|uniref:PhzF family phenazine biosynthesis protein n=1 Tax=Corynebacterium glyciniphilum TaxID=1404244 RepID=UPI002655F1B4|nr:PhzF family phenazine biosynthesis protein [Corynebacterium glyciniphilum]MDN5682826.1 PhzF family phenazine biosynthesis protein [Corynebacterium glyciniphilum]MDN6706772.1 PhzF family phenazine biosynthesis protein [Corynebacterium glyciniphilum]